MEMEYIPAFIDSENVRWYPIIRSSGKIVNLSKGDIVRYRFGDTFIRGVVRRIRDHHRGEAFIYCNFEDRLSATIPRRLKRHETFAKESMLEVAVLQFLVFG